MNDNETLKLEIERLKLENENLKLSKNDKTDEEIELLRQIAKPLNAFEQGKDSTKKMLLGIASIGFIITTIGVILVFTWL